MPNNVSFSAGQELTGIAAEQYAINGLQVFPLKPGGKTPLTGHGYKDATSNVGLVRSWWENNPHANIGLPTGLLFDVVDVDSVDTWIYVSDHITFPKILAVAATPRGWHFYVAPTGEGCTARLGGVDGLDYRGIGGYVVAPSSQGYRWLTPSICYRVQS